jgi:hypothetical protein
MGVDVAVETGEEEEVHVEYYVVRFT